MEPLGSPGRWQHPHHCRGADPWACPRQSSRFRVLLGHLFPQVVIKTQTEYQLSPPDQPKKFPDLEAQKLACNHPEEGRRVTQPSWAHGAQRSVPWGVRAGEMARRRLQAMGGHVWARLAGTSCSLACCQEERGTGHHPVQRPSSCYKVDENSICLQRGSCLEPPWAPPAPAVCPFSLSDPWVF